MSGTGFSLQITVKKMRSEPGVSQGMTSHVSEQPKDLTTDTPLSFR